MISSQLCVRCKGKLLCGLSYCPILQKYETQLKVAKNVEEEFAGTSPPSVFVSWHSYPKVTVSPLSASERIRNASLLDFPEQWYGLPEQKIIEFRSLLLMSGKNFKASDASKPSYELVDIQELAMSFDQVDVDIELLKKPKAKLSFSAFAGPLGPKAPLKRLELESNPKIPRKVDYLVSDIDVKANAALLELYNAGFPVSFLHKLLSAGLLGVEKNRKLVPTRWAITAVDANISKELINEKVKSYETIDKYELYHSNYLDNDFWVLLIPSVWAFEQLECWLPGSTWMGNAKEYHIIQDHELYEGRKEYASNVEGAYYAARLAVTEHLIERRRQAACIVFREIGAKYSVPLGVWQIRENVRHALKSRPLVFETLKTALKFLEGKLAVPIKQYIKESKVIGWFKHQKKLWDFSQSA
ncbi:MAG: hypothetical protein J7J87_01565 [Candidatus Diapherotrites archaeon]|nr:hypothetical protein [Candidatus Diapherotrites archaeon]